MIAEPVEKNFTVPQGADYPIRLRYLVSDGTPVNLSGSIIRGAIRKHPSDAAAVINFTAANNNVFLDTVTGYFGIDFVAAATSAIEPTKYYYDIEVVRPSGDVTRAMQGIITLTPEITK